MVLLITIIPALIFWVVFGLVILNIPYPQSLTQASAFQLIAFFIPLFLALIFTINIFLKFLIRSFLVSAAFIVFLTLQALQALNLVTFILTTVGVGLMLSYFKKKKQLTSSSKISKLPSLQRRKR